MKSAMVLIVDDEPDICELLEITLGRMQLATRRADCVQAALKCLNEQSFDLVLTDMNLPDGNGLQLVQEIQTRWPTIPVAVITAYGSMETAVTALKVGAFDFISKPVELERLRELVKSALKQPPPPAQDTQEPILGCSKSILQLRETVAKLARGQAPVFISGESGSGKELVARRIHELGNRSSYHFIAVNCGAIPAELMESEFFGHKRGSFTGAQEDKIGLFQAANQGTLFLDEVADLPLAMQVKLLRALQEKAVRPIGSTKELPINVRIISATHKDLAQEVADGNFRQDLFYRIHVIPLRVPALRERGDDIIQLAQSFLLQIARDWNQPQATLHEDALLQLRRYSFPGNVRELQNILERAVTLCDANIIRPEHLHLPQSAEFRSIQSPTVMHEVPQGGALEDYLFEIERKAILNALEETRWNRTLAARKLGMTFRSLRYRLKKMGLDNEDDSESPVS
ncbi:MAG: sigma-54-dependent Fis family transcriptional regulator [Pseudomonadales bacterium]|nr:sigma-54-dependent Fis family transcriptional regulator [Pseudomonadales bacterium]